MNTFVRTLVLLVFLVPCASDPSLAAVEIPELQVKRTTPSELASTDAQIAALQEQVRVLREQLALLQSVLQVTSSGATLQAPAVTIVSAGGILIRSGRETTLLTGTDLLLRSASGTTIDAAGGARVETLGSLSFKGQTIQFNGGRRPLATVGSAVSNGVITSGSASILGD